MSYVFTCRAHRPLGSDKSSFLGCCTVRRGLEQEAQVEQVAHVEQEAPKEEDGEEEEGARQGEASSRSTTG
jgi:hypothetical protein